LSKIYRSYNLDLKYIYFTVKKNAFKLTHMHILNMHSHFKVNVSNDKAELYEKIVSVNLMTIVFYIVRALS